jgi:glucokinase
VTSKPIRAQQDALTAGIDLGASKLELALVDASGRIAARERRPTGAGKPPDDIIADIAALLGADPLSKLRDRLAGIGIGVAGQVDPLSGFVRAAPNLKWRNVPLAERLQDAVGLPVSVMNDVQAITYGEWMHGEGEGAADLVCLFVGTGVGGGVVMNRQLLCGSTGSAGEFGHITIDRTGPRCSCGNRGCLEAFAGGWAIARRARELAAADPEAGVLLLSLAGNDREQLTAAVVANALRAGDPLAGRIMAEVSEMLGIGLAAIANAFNPALLILGGGVIEGMPELVGSAEREMRLHALSAAVQPLRIVRSRLGADAGAIGAAARIRERLHESRGQQEGRAKSI